MSAWTDVNIGKSDADQDAVPSAWSIYVDMDDIEYNADALPHGNERNTDHCCFGPYFIRFRLKQTSASTYTYDFRIIRSLDKSAPTDYFNDPTVVFQAMNDSTGTNSWIRDPRKYRTAEQRIYNFQVIYYRRLLIDNSIGRDEIEFKIPVPAHTVEYFEKHTDDGLGSPYNTDGTRGQGKLFFCVLTDAEPAQSSTHAYRYDMNVQFFDGVG